jgi:hypothetical protein
MAITAIIAATIAMAFAQYELHKALRAIDSVLSSIKDRRSSSRSLSQTREKIILSSGTACDPTSIKRTLVSPSDSNSAVQAEILSSSFVTVSLNFGA